MHPHYSNNHGSGYHKSFWILIPFILFFFFILPAMGNMPFWMIMILIFFFFKIFRFGLFGYRRSGKDQRYSSDIGNMTHLNNQNGWDVPISYGEPTAELPFEYVELNQQQTFCIGCGIKLSSVTKFCTNCGTNQIPS